MAQDSSSPLLRLWSHASSYRAKALVATFFSVTNKLLDLAPPLLIGLAVDVVTLQEASFLGRNGMENPASQIWFVSVLTFLIWGLESVTEYLFSTKWRFLAQSVQHDLRLEAYDKVQHLELAFFEDRDTGELMSVLNDDVNQLERFLDDGANSIIQVVTTVIAIGGLFFVLQPQVAWMAMIPMPFVIAGSVAYQKRLAPRYSAVRQEVGALNSDLAGNLGGIATIKSYTAERREEARIRERSDAYRKRNKGAIRVSSAFAPLIRMVIVCGFTAALVKGGMLVIDGVLNVGAYTTMVFMTQRLLWPLTRLGQTFDLYQRAMASANRIFGLLDTESKIADGEQTLQQPRGEVRFDNVAFAYSNGVPVFGGIDLEIAAGKTTAIVGSTGAGKSTVVKLLLRFYEPTGGRVTFDGHELSTLSVASLRGAVGLVSQDVFLFHGTVRENVIYGRPDASEEEIKRAIELAEADEFIAKLPQGIDTIVGERGQKLSGGQRQRLSIARAVLRDPTLLVLDEATSSIDNETEAAIQRSLEKIAVDRTTLVIAHRLSTVRNADRIYVLEDGGVLESGKHEELVARDGLYASLWRVQTGERLAKSMG